MENNRTHILLLFIAALIWGTTFVAQSIGADYVDAYTYLAGRSWIAVVFLSGLIPVTDRIADRRGTSNRRPRDRASRMLLIKAGIYSGIALGAASLAQQIGMAYTTASKAGFITTLYIVIVPIMGILIGQKLHLNIFIAVLISLVGMYLLCMTGTSLALGAGDLYVCACALIFSIDILIIDHFSPLVDGVRLSRVQFIVIGAVTTIIVLMRGIPERASLTAALPAILYAGLFSSGIAYTLQIIGQDRVNAALASLIMSLESVFSALSAWLILHERMSSREILGSCLIFAAVLLAQYRRR